MGAAEACRAGRPAAGVPSPSIEAQRGPIRPDPYLRPAVDRPWTAPGRQLDCCRPSRSERTVTERPARVADAPAAARVAVLIDTAHRPGCRQRESSAVVRGNPRANCTRNGGTTMPWPMPSAKNYGPDATMRDFRTERHASAPLPPHRSRPPVGLSRSSASRDARASSRQQAGHVVNATGLTSRTPPWSVNLHRSSSTVVTRTHPWPPGGANANDQAAGGKSTCLKPGPVFHPGYSGMPCLRAGYGIAFPLPPRPALEDNSTPSPDYSWRP